MARLSGAAVALGGADNLTEIVCIQGEQKIWEGVFTDENGPVNISNFTLEATAKYYTADVGVGSSGDLKFAVGSFKEMNPQPPQPSLLIEKTDALTGTFKFVLPDDIYAAEISPDISVDVPVVVIFFKYTAGVDTVDDPQPILMHRLLAVIRTGVAA